MKRLSILLSFILLVNVVAIVSAQDDWRDELVCIEGETRDCGSNVGECVAGQRTCIVGSWSECAGGKGPEDEVCNNGLDEDCNGVVDDCEFEFPIPGWMLVGLGGLMLVGAWVYEKITAVKEDEGQADEEVE